MSFFGVIGPTLAIHGSIHHQLTSWFFVTNTDTHTPRLFCGFNSTPQDCSPNIEREISTPSPGQWPAVPIDIYNTCIWTIWFTRLPSQFVQQTSWIPSIYIFILVIPWCSCLNLCLCYRKTPRLKCFFWTRWIKLPSFCGTFVGSTIVCWIKSSCLLLWSHFCWIVIEKQL
jgi:hypothetical protein